MTNPMSITKKIASISLVKNENKESSNKASEDVISLEFMHEKVKRPEKLQGITYKIKPPTYNDALYVTLNYFVCNKGTAKEKKVPFELFINSKDMSNFQWVVALTRMISGVFRKGGDVKFVVDELCAVSDPNGAYWLKGKFYKSVVHHLGEVLHTIFIEDLGEDFENEKEKRKELPSLQETDIKKERCTKCGNFAVIREGGCKKCEQCGDSNCE